MTQDISNFNSEARQASLRQKLGQFPLCVPMPSSVFVDIPILPPKTWVPTLRDLGNRAPVWKWSVSKERRTATKQEGASTSVAFPFGADLNKLLYADPVLEGIFSKYPKYFPDLIEACKDWKTNSAEQFFEHCIYELKMRPWEITFLLEEVKELITPEEHREIFQMHIEADYTDLAPTPLFVEEPNCLEEVGEQEGFSLNYEPGVKRAASLEIDPDAKRSRVVFHLESPT